MCWQIWSKHEQQYEIRNLISYTPALFEFTIRNTLLGGKFGSTNFMMALEEKISAFVFGKHRLTSRWKQPSSDGDRHDEKR